MIVILKFANHWYIWFLVAH